MENISWPTGIATALLAWFRDHARDLPWRRTRDPYAIWISEIMLQQTQVKTVIPYWERWMKALPDIDALAEATPEQVLKLWEGLGYYRRARHLQKAAQMLHQDRAGRFPDNLDQVLALPGIGRYTAGAICSIAFNQPTPILDGNVLRVLTRLHRIRDHALETTAQKHLWQLAHELVTEAARLETAVRRRKDRSPHCSHLNQALMELGALICTPREPLCPQCPLANACAARKDGSFDRIPNLGPRVGTQARHFIALIIGRRGRWLVRQRPAENVNGNLWEFPNFEITRPGTSSPSFTLAQKSELTPAHQRQLTNLVQDRLGWKITSCRGLGRIKHAITRYRMTVDAYVARWDGEKLGLGAEYRWVDAHAAESLAFASAHRKLWHRLRSTQPSQGNA